jgi:hypothetical protein
MYFYFVLVSIASFTIVRGESTSAGENETSHQDTQFASFWFAVVLLIVIIVTCCYMCRFWMEDTVWWDPNKRKSDSPVIKQHTNVDSFDSDEEKDEKSEHGYRRNKRIPPPKDWFSFHMFGPHQNRYNHSSSSIGSITKPIVNPVEYTGVVVNI